MTPPLLTRTVRPKHCDPMFLLRELGRNRATVALLESIDRNHGTNDCSFLALGARDAFTIAGNRLRGSKRCPDGAVRDPLQPFESMVGTGAKGGFLTMGYIGFLSYESLRLFESIELEVDPNVPDGYFVLPEVLIKMDHRKQEVSIVSHEDSKEDLDAIERTLHQSPFHDDALQRKFVMDNIKLPDPEEVQALRKTTQETYCDSVRKAQEEIKKGEAFQIVLSQELRMKTHAYPIDIYAQLRMINPSPYMYVFKTPERTIVGASPETLVRVDGRTLTYRPIAGTRKRSDDPIIDAKMRTELLNDQKERSEHQMLVDLGRNDLGRIAKIGSVRVENPFHIENYAHVMHIVSDITAELADGKNALDALRSVFPAGTLTGAPKLRACEIISNLERAPRGIYGGAFGYIDASGNLDMAICIRTMLFDERGMSLRVGAGIVKDSIPEREDDECMHKARSCLAAVFSASTTSNT